MSKEHLRQLFWRSTDLTFLRIIIVANRPTLPFSWGGGRRFVTGRRQIIGQTQGDYGPPQVLQNSDKSTTTASYAFNHTPKPFNFISCIIFRHVFDEEASTVEKVVMLFHSGKGRYAFPQARL